ncbi:unnamed protein product [Clonostachys rosea]|uniref:Heterokaryon incompatibility domain-containing protein n=1 Tax=Bionectria ochroleuca TaxID=29856 RepID=A0ABY6TUH3_BIOOC|nr:unnamed protein product [Clonostachys rosea]
MSSHSQEALGDRDLAAVSEKDAHLRYLRPSDGQLVPLVTQSFDQEGQLRGTAQWTRLGRPVNQVPSFQLLSYWILSPVLGREADAELDLTPSSIGWTALRLVVSTPLSIALLSGVTHGLGAFRISWLPQSPVIELDHRYDEVHIPSSGSAPFRRFQDMEAGAESFIGRGPGVGRTRSQPTHLCIIKDAEQRTYETIPVAADADTEFVFVSYARTQFNILYGTETDPHSHLGEQAREASRQIARRDRETLIQWGIDAAQAAGKQAFWIDFECIRDEEDPDFRSAMNEQRICQIVRAAHSIVVAVGPSVSERVSSLVANSEPPEHASEKASQWLQQWAASQWSLPHLLLSPSGQNITLYILSDPEEPKVLTKRDVADLGWENSRSVIKDLVDHFEGSANLPPLRLIQLALNYFSRQNLTPFHSWDVTYAIMSLFPDHNKPHIYPSDSPFQVFARLATAIEPRSSILERIICDAPFGKEQEDWNTDLTEIQPTFRINDITETDAIVLDYVPAASICWDQIPAAPSLDFGSQFTRRLIGISLSIAVGLPLLRAYFANIYLQFSNPELELLRVLFNLINVGARYTAGVALVAPLYFLKAKKSTTHQQWIDFGFYGLAFYLTSGLVGELLVVFGLAAFQQIANDPTATGAFISGLFFQTTPLAFLFGAKTRPAPAKARLIGIEGLADRATVERYIWGYDFGKLTHYSIRGSSASSGPAPESDFTLVDIYGCTITYFRCRKPPVAVFLCGKEGDGRRAVLCSYDHHAGVYHREQILRLDGKVAKKMQYVQSAKLSLNAMPDYAESDIEPAQERLPDGGVQPLFLNSTSADETAFLAGRKYKKFIPSGFLLATLLGARVFGLTFYHSLAGKEEAYFTGFLLVQPLAYFFVRRRIFTRVIVPAAYWYEIIFSLYTLSDMTYHKEVVKYKHLLEGLLGISAGLMLPLLVMYTWSWFPARQQPVRMVVWSVLGSQVFSLLNAYNPMFYRSGQLFLSGAVLFIGTVGANYIGLPEDFPRLDTAEKVVQFRRAAVARHSVNGILDEASAASFRKTFLQLRMSRYQWIRSLLVFFVSALSGLHVWRDRSRGLGKAVAETRVTVAMLVISLFIAMLPRLHRYVMVFCDLSPSVGFFFRLFRVRGVFGSTAQVLARTNAFVFPLFLASIVNESESWTDTTVTLFSSMMGWGVARLLSAIFYPPIPPPATLIPQAMVLGVLWIYQARHKKNAIAQARSTTIRSEYQDNVEIEALT